MTVDNVTRLDKKLSKPTVRAVKETRAYTAFRVVNATLLVLIAAITLYPFANLAAQAFSSESYINSGQVTIWPRGFNLTTFDLVMSDSMFWRNYQNTVYYTVVATLVEMMTWMSQG